MEKLFIRLRQQIPGFDHLKAVDPEKFADIHHWWDVAAPLLNVDKINDFYVYQGEYGSKSTTWHEASAGLKALRAVAAYYREGKGSASDDVRRLVADTLGVVEQILEEADLRDTGFCFVGNY